MKLIKIAVDERIKQLKRQINTQFNPMIKQILEDEIKALEIEYQTLQQKK